MKYFNLLEEEILKETGGAPEEIQGNIHGIIRIFSLIGNILELYIPNLMNTASSFIDVGDSQNRIYDDFTSSDEANLNFDK